jgi:hypothetical protein
MKTHIAILMAAAVAALAVAGCYSMASYKCGWGRCDAVAADCEDHSSEACHQDMKGLGFYCANAVAQGMGGAASCQFIQSYCSNADNTDVCEAADRGAVVGQRFAIAVSAVNAAANAVPPPQPKTVVVQVPGARAAAVQNRAVYCADMQERGLAGSYTFLTSCP